MAAEHVCNLCGWKFNRKYNLKQHLTNRKKPCKIKRLKSFDIPTFDGSEFGTGKPKSKETMDKIERLVQSRSRSPHRLDNEKNRAVQSILGQKETKDQKNHPQTERVEQKVTPVVQKETILTVQNDPRIHPSII